MYRVLDDRVKESCTDTLYLLWSEWAIVARRLWTRRKAADIAEPTECIHIRRVHCVRLFAVVVNEPLRVACSKMPRRTQSCQTPLFELCSLHRCFHPPTASSSTCRSPAVVAVTTRRTPPPECQVLVERYRGSGGFYPACMSFSYIITHICDGSYALSLSWLMLGVRLCMRKTKEADSNVILQSTCHLHTKHHELTTSSRNGISRGGISGTPYKWDRNYNIRGNSAIVLLSYFV